MKYEVTIGIPVYNVEKYIRRTMDSALAQTFASIEFLILDDCGTDGTIEIIRGLQQNHPRGKDIHIISQEYNKGVGAARNRILKEAQGRYLYFLDSDDLIEPTTISIMMSAAQKYNAQVVMASYERVELYRHEPQKELYQHPNRVFTKSYEFASYAFSKYACLQANIWNVLIDLNLVRKNHLRFVNTNFWEDMAFKYELVTYVTRAVLMSEVTYSYICRENTLSNFQNRDKIEKDEIFRNVATMDTLKCHYRNILWRPYFANWLTFVLDTDYYIILEAIRLRNKITPEISDLELRNFLYVPMSLWQVLRFGSSRCWLYKFLSILPPRMAIMFMKGLSVKK